MTLHPPVDIQAFQQLCTQQTPQALCPSAEQIVQQIPCYQGDFLRALLADADPLRRAQLLQEWAQVLKHGPGVWVIRAAYPDLAIIQRQNEVFEAIIRQEAGQTAGDHFAHAGANDRIWNVLQKSALYDPAAFMDYYKNPLLTLAAEAWLGPGFQLTAQVNRVHPGGAAQAPHRDYHLGFQNAATLAQYPPHVHSMSTMLTLQGAIAHTDMDAESGATCLLPFSQQYPQGYLAASDPAFVTYFKTHQVQLALKQGDALFFNPALFHAAGDNQTQHVQRTANLLQLSSAFGRAMEAVDHYRISSALYPLLLHDYATLPALEQQALLAIICEAYAFPTNLDTDPPLHGMAPETHQQLTQRALAQSWPVERYQQAIQQLQAKRCA